MIFAGSVTISATSVTPKFAIGARSRTGWKLRSANIVAFAGMVLNGSALASVYPSGADFATVSSAMLPAAPGRLSITTVCPSDCDTRSIRMRVTISVVPAAANGNTTRIGRSGYSARAAPDAQSAATQHRTTSHGGPRSVSFSRRAALPPMTLAYCALVMPISLIMLKPFIFRGTIGGESVPNRKWSSPTTSARIRRRAQSSRVT